MKRLAALLLFASLAATASAQEAPAPTPAPAPAAAPAAPAAAPAAAPSATTGATYSDKLALREFQGSLSLVGNSPFTTLLFVDRDGVKMALTGALEKELRHLSGLTLWIKGKPDGTDGAYSKFEVTDYEILDCGDGKKPYLGVLTVVQGKLVLAIKDAGPGIELMGNRKVLETLKAAAGTKAWVAGELKDGALKVRRYKVLSID